jgi:RNA polymerase sigma factor (sigma-70 family)
VFVALARKAPRLGGLETLAGWLHRTTVLESRARIRAELLRKRRDETAAELARIQHEGAPALEALVPLLDEALLHLREQDRLALVLRFLEQRSLREVGGVLGVDEDAARKRVSRALDRVTAFFRERGFVAGGGAVAVISSAAHAAPASLAVAAANAGITAGGAASGLNLLLLHLISLSKTQTAALCAVLLATPLAIQWNADAVLAREHAGISARTATARMELNALETDLQSVRAAHQRLQNDTLNLQARGTAIHAQRIGRAPRERYQWDENSPVLRVPKQLLEHLPVAAVHRSGTLTDQIKEVLQLTDLEAEQAQAALNRFL